MEQLNSDENYYFSSSHYPHLAVMQLQKQKQAIAKPQQIVINGAQKEQKKVRKHKGIRKEEKETSQKGKKAKRKRDESIISSMGRPQNRDIEIEHLKQNKSFNDIIYHFSRFTIFLKLIQKNNINVHALELQNNQSGWMSQTENIMSVQNFPAFDQEKPAFLLHPNSLHYVFQYHKLHSNRQKYSSQEVKYMFFAFLKRRNMLSTNIYQYITDYWPDIINLVNNPEGDNEIQVSPGDNNLQIQVEDMPHSNAEPRDLINTVLNGSDQQSDSKGQKKKGKGGSTEMTQMEELRDQLLKDETIVAYQIACYLHSCSQKFNFGIVPAI